MAGAGGCLKWKRLRRPTAQRTIVILFACVLSSKFEITCGPSAELGRGPPQAAWRGAVVHPSGGPSAPGRRCWRLGRKRPSPFSNSGPTPLRLRPTLRPEFGGPESLRCCCAKGVGHRAQLMLRARRGARENDYPVPLLRTSTPQKHSLSLSYPRVRSRAVHRHLRPLRDLRGSRQDLRRLRLRSLQCFHPPARHLHRQPLRRCFGIDTCPCRAAS